MANSSDPISTSSDGYIWTGSSGGSWGSASNWTDTTSWPDVQMVPGSNNAVTIAGPSSGNEVIVDGGSSASLTLTGSLLLSGQYATGALSVGSYQAPSTPSSSGTLIVGNVSLANGSSLSASTVNVLDGSLTLNSGTSLSASGLVTIGTANSTSSSGTYVPPAQGTLSIAGGATLTASDGLSLADYSTLSASGTGTQVLIDGTLALGTAQTTTNGITTYGSGGYLTIVGGAHVSVTGTFVEPYNGSISVTGTGSSLSVSGLATLVNASLYIQGGSSVQFGDLSLLPSSSTTLSNVSTNIILDTTSRIEIGTSGGAAAGALTVDAGHTLAVDASTSISGTVVDNGIITVNGVHLTMGALSGSGQVQISSGGTLTFNGAAAATDTIAFSGYGGTLEIGQSSTYAYNPSTNSFGYTYTPYTVAATLTGLGNGDSITVDNTTLTNAVYASTGTNTGTLTLYNGSTAVETLDIAGGSLANTNFIINGGTVTLNMAPLTFTDGRLEIDGSHLPANSIMGLQSGDLIDLTGITYDPDAVITQESGNVLRITEGSQTYDLTFDPNTDLNEFTFLMSADGNGLDITASEAPCYCRGTNILTENGEVPVEDLKIGDRVHTLFNGVQPIKWIGRRSYSRRFAVTQPDILPICIRAEAFAPSIPHRDLWVSPHHAIFFPYGDKGVLIEAVDLLNGQTIDQPPLTTDVEYFHIELDTHDILIADGALAESFLDDNSREMFHNAGEFGKLYPETFSMPARYCLPRLHDGIALETVRSAIDRRHASAPHDARQAA